MAARRRNAGFAADSIQPDGALVIFVAVWELACRALHVPAYLVPAPSAILTDTWQLAGTVMMHTQATTETVQACRSPS